MSGNLFLPITWPPCSNAYRHGGYADIVVFKVQDGRHNVYKIDQLSSLPKLEMSICWIISSYCRKMDLYQVLYHVVVHWSTIACMFWYINVPPWKLHTNTYLWTNNTDITKLLILENQDGCQGFENNSRVPLQSRKGTSMYHYDHERHLTETLKI